MNRVMLENFEALVSLHEDYIRAGARIITTNTFRTQPLSAGRFGQDYRQLVRLAVEAARLAVERAQIPGVLIAGSNAPS